MATEVESATSLEHLEGVLHREEGGLLGKSFKPRFCIFKNNVLRIFNEDKDGGLGTKEITAVSGEIVTAVRHATTATRKTKGLVPSWFLIEIVTTIGIECLAAESDTEGHRWLDALQQLIYKPAAAEEPSIVKLLTVEAFVHRGVRVYGQVQPEVLAELGVGPKYQDERGWFCDRYISPAELLNIISAFGWYLDSVIASEAVTPMDTKTPVPVHLFTFMRL